MAVQLVSKGNGGWSGTSPQVDSETWVAPADLLVCFVSDIVSASSVSVQFNGVTGTQAVSASASGLTNRIWYWTKSQLPTSGGSYDFRLYWGEEGNVYFSWASFRGIVPTSPLEGTDSLNVVTNTVITATLDSGVAAGNLKVAAVGGVRGDNCTISWSPDTNIYDRYPESNHNFGAGYGIATTESDNEMTATFNLSNARLIMCAASFKYKPTPGIINIF